MGTIAAVLTALLAVGIDDVSTWRELIEWAWGGIQNASPWLAPLLWSLLVVAAAVLWVKGKGWQKLKAALKWAQRAVRAVDQFLTLTEDISYIKGQLQNNGGSTVKDEVQTLGRTVARIEKKVDRAARTAAEAKRTATTSQKLLQEHLSRST
ncbi:hypothetical protein [Microcella pacifica]|uniref:Uncharacterized protein n=1 Tax=Microcella pacifica TaxID=2591847 RepID=A0A9E5MHD5_9MICO|nr:hypothetical protein [Microcella pacifica]NHF62225.1 hypothetical protein [Microcella pacifica]